MVTADEIGAGHGLRGSRARPIASGLSRAAADISLVPGEYAAQEGDERALFAVLEGRIEAVKLVDGIERVVGERRPGDIFGEVPITLGTVFPVGFRAAEQSRVMRIEPHDYHAVAAVAPDVATRSRQAGGRPDRRIARPAGHRGRAAAAAGDRGRGSLGCLLHRAAALPRAQPGHVQVAHARRAGRGRAVGRPVAGRGRLPGDPRRRRQDRGATAAAPRRRAAGTRHRAGRRRVRHGHRRRRPVRPGGGRVRSVGGPADDRDRARGARRPGRHLVADRELPRLPVRRLRRRAGEPRAAAGAEARRRDPRDPGDHADRRRDPSGAPRRRRRPAGPDDHPRLRRLVAAPRRSRASTGSPARASSTARRAARRRTATASTSTSSAPATPPGRRPCSSPPTRAA